MLLSSLLSTLLLWKPYIQQFVGMASKWPQKNCPLLLRIGVWKHFLKIQKWNQIGMGYKSWRCRWEPNCWTRTKTSPHWFHFWGFFVNLPFCTKGEHLGLRLCHGTNFFKYIFIEAKLNAKNELVWYLRTAFCY